MPNRFTEAQRRRVYAFLVERDGERCKQCGAEPPEIPLQIDHIDHDRTHNWPDNWQLLCQGCNQKNYNIFKKTSMNGRQAIVSSARYVRRHNGASNYSLNPDTKLSQVPGALCVCVNECTCDSTSKARQMVDYWQGSPEMQANELYEVRFRTWLQERIARDGQMVTRDAITTGAEILGCSVASTSRYLKKLKSLAGPLVEQRTPGTLPTLFLKAVATSKKHPNGRRPSEIPTTPQVNGRRKS